MERILKITREGIKPTKDQLIASLVIILAVIIVYLFIPRSGADWSGVFHPAGRAVLAGKNPYEIDQFMLAPWSLLLFVPLSLLSIRAGLAIMTIFGLVAFTYVAVKLGARFVGLAAILLSPQVLMCFITGNVDWLALLGFVLPPPVGLFFLAIKPQIGAPLILYWFVEALREKRLMRTFIPFGTAVLLAYLVTGWPMQITTVQAKYNVSLWPMSLPFGIVLLASAVYRRRERLAQGIGPLLSPHVMVHSWSAMLYALAPNTFELVIAVVMSWGIVYYILAG